MKKLILLFGLTLAGFTMGYSQSSGGGNGSGNGNYGTNGAAGQEIPQNIVSEIARLASPILGYTQGAIIHAYHILECEIICVDPLLKAYRVTMGGNSGVILLEDGI